MDNPKKDKSARRKNQPVNIGGHLIPRDLLRAAQAARAQTAQERYDIYCRRKKSILGRILIGTLKAVDKVVTLYLCRGVK